MATPVLLPKLGLTQDEGTVVRWLRPEGSRVTKGEPLFEVLTEKATLEVESPATGVLLRILVPEGATVPVATPIAVIGEPGEEIPPAPGAGVSVAPAAGAASPAVEGSAAPGAPPSPPRGRVRISPRARALAEAAGLDVSTLVGTGPDGRIVERDVQRALEERAARGGAAPAAQPAPASPAASAGVSARMRAVIARRMVESLRESAQLTLTTEVDMAEAARMRDEVAPELERREGVRPTYTDLVIRATALALREHPAVNARWEGEGIRRLEEIHIGVAVALDEGLLVPVLRHADRMSLAQIARAVRELSERARALRLRPEEMQGSTFTVTNLGMYEIDAFTPILNPPESGILGVGRVVRRPVAVGERVEVRPTVVLSLTFDHRVVDGAPAAQFLQRVKHILEHPYLLLLP
jgi:pyruvate dehydrogenase E2 component (dihydrolipoamide acetyltransferase)